ncbi:helix-turn-helix transcriptional regulator [Rubrobacter aplysinae]|uniref:helix-turn-helix transcriptional regulator n=1 Tax=Rubrobacter aplysinae TaxID=909625 RepID=UPI00128E3C81|nr:response regulator transcription factor [Rubrobacter aplysinae]
MAETESDPGGIWIHSGYPVVSLGLTEVLKGEAEVHPGYGPPEGWDPHSIIYYCCDAEEPADEIRSLRSRYPEACLLAFGMHAQLPLARAALGAGAHGFIHAGMQPNEIVRALNVARKGEVVVPRELLKGLVEEKAPVDLAILTSRQLEILRLVSDGLTNSQIAQHLYLSEFTIKQHLRSAFKTLGVRNRTEAAILFRSNPL